jgi:hypothetical protein
MPEALYDADILIWSEQQAELLRQRSENALDWDNLAEEIEGVGLSELHAVESFLVQALVHRLKAEARPQEREVPHWQAEARRFCGDAAARFVPSMRQRIDMARLYRRALLAMPETIDGIRPQTAAPQRSSVTLEDLLGEDAE